VTRSAPIPALAAAVAALVAVATLTASASGAGTSAATGRLTFWSDEQGPSVWIVGADGSGLKRISRRPENAKRPVVSPDGRLVAFDGARPGSTPMRDFDILLMRPDGTGVRAVTSGSAWDIDARWSADGRTLSFSRLPGGDWRRSRIHTVDLQTGRVRYVTRGQFARWAPDGSQFVVDAPTAHSQGDIFVVGADGTRRRQLTSTPDLEQPTDWSPDGRRILFTRFTPAGASDVYVLTLASGVERRLTRDGKSGGAAWSPDGKSVAFVREHGGVTRIVIARADGSGRRFATPPGVNAFDPTWG
jgi:Tol biopolymer transport system component